MVPPGPNKVKGTISLQRKYFYFINTLLHENFAAEKNAKLKCCEKCILSSTAKLK